MSGVALALCTFCDTHGAKVVFATHDLGHGGQRQTAEPVTFCPGCKSLPASKRFLISESRDATWLSSNVEDVEDVAAREDMTRVCSHLLAMETREDEVIVFNPGMRYFSAVAGVNFRLKDSEYFRGFKRRYSLAFFALEPSETLENSEALATRLKVVREGLQAMAERNFVKKTDLSEEDLRRLRPTKPRKLQDLTNTDVYLMLHYQFIEILMSRKIVKSTRFK